MTTRKRKRGTLMIDLIIPGVGRIAKASGTKKPVEHKRRKKLLNELYERGYLDVLADIRDGRLSIAEVFSKVLQHGYEVFEKRAALANLHHAFSEWMQNKECSDDYRRTLGTTMRYLEAHAPSARLVDLPDVAQRLRDLLPAPSFNRTRAHLMAFAKATMGRRHPSSQGLLDVNRKREQVKRPPVRLSPERMCEYFPAPLTDYVDAIAWSLVTTGMGAKEYWGEWAVEEDRIHILGTKRESRNRQIPKVAEPVPPPFSRFMFESRFRRRTGRAVVPYQLRGTYVNWLEDARVTRSRRMMYLGHSAGDTTAKYERHEVSGFLGGDAALVREYLRQHLPAQAPHEVRAFLGV